MPTPSQPLREFIQGWEGCRLHRYLDSAGRPTIGWGDLLENDDSVQECTQDEADERFERKLTHFGNGVAELLELSLDQHQYDALVSFAYNAGLANLRGSTLLRLVNTERPYLVPAQFSLWNKKHVAGVLMIDRGLTKRRAAERALWEYADYTGRP